MNRKLIWGIPIAMVILGLAVLLISRLLPHFTAAVTDRGQVYYTPAHRSARTKTSARYRVGLTVEYTDEKGEVISAGMTYVTIHPNSIPKVGDRIAVCRGLKGLTVYPNRDLIGLGGAGAVIGGFFLVTFLLTKWSMNRKRKKAV